MIERIDLPYITERFIGISQPKNNESIAISYNGVHVINLKTNSVSHDKTKPEGGENYSVDSQILEFRNQTFEIHGLYGKNEIHKNSLGEVLIIDITKENIFLQKGKTILWSFKYEDLSGDWYYLSFSKDFKYIIFLLPYEVYFF